MSDYIKDESIEDLLDKATIEYGKIQDQINILSDPQKPSPIPSPSGTIFNPPSHEYRKEFDRLKGKQEEIKLMASEKAQHLCQSKSNDEKEIIQNRVEEWGNSDIYKHYKHLKSLEPVFNSTIKANEQLREHEKNPTKSWKNFLDKDLNYTEQSKKETKPEKNTSDKKMSMADRFSMDLNYKGLDRSDVGYGKDQQAKNYADNRDEITSKPEPGGNPESKEPDIDKDE